MSTGRLNMAKAGTALEVHLPRSSERARMPVSTGSQPTSRKLTRLEVQKGPFPGHVSDSDENRKTNTL